MNEDNKIDDKITKKYVVAYHETVAWLSPWCLHGQYDSAEEAAKASSELKAELNVPTAVLELVQQ